MHLVSKQKTYLLENGFGTKGPKKTNVSWTHCQFYMASGTNSYLVLPPKNKNNSSQPNQRIALKKKNNFPTIPFFQGCAKSVFRCSVCHQWRIKTLPQGVAWMDPWWDSAVAFRWPDWKTEAKDSCQGESKRFTLFKGLLKTHPKNIWRVLFLQLDLVGDNTPWFLLRWVWFLGKNSLVMLEDPRKMSS